MTLDGHESTGGADSHAQVSAGDLELNLKDSLEHYLECSDDPDFVEVRVVHSVAACSSRARQHDPSRFRRSLSSCLNSGRHQS